MVSKTKEILILLVIMIVFGCGSALGAEDKYVIAKVGDIEITVFELQRETQRILPFTKSFHGGVSKEKLLSIRKMAFDRLIDQAYKVRYANNNGITVPESQLNKKVDKVLNKFGSGESLEKALGDESFSRFKSSVARLLVAEIAEDQAVNAKADVGDEELLTFYRGNKFMYQRPKTYRASHILIKVDPSLVGAEREEFVVKAQELATKAKAGEDFYNLAYYNSDEDTKFVGGDIGYFHSGQTVKEFEDAVQEMEPGDIVGPVETISGFHVIKLTDVQEARLLEFDEVKSKIKKTIEDKRRQQLFDEWMTDLKSQVTTEIYHPDLKL